MAHLLNHRWRLAHNGDGMKRGSKRFLIAAVGLVAVAAGGIAIRQRARVGVFRPGAAVEQLAPVGALSPFQAAVVADLRRQVAAGIRYRDGYFQGGEPPPEVGVCTDVVVRAFRRAGVDLQQGVAGDVRARRRAYDIERPDRNIDHRRCRNLVVFFDRHARPEPASKDRGAWKPGDVVFWDTNADRRVDHVGVIANGRDAEGNPTVVHHWPGLPVSETDGLFRFPVTHHFRWPGDPGRARRVTLTNSSRRRATIGP